MKPQNIDDSHKRRGWVPFSTFAFVDRPPPRIAYLDHLVPYRDADDNLDIPWGVYGTTSFNACSFFASHYAANQKRLLIVLTLWYYIEGFAAATSKLPHSLEQTNGFLHMGRLGADLRDELREEMLSMLRKQRSPEQLSRSKSLPWGMLLMREPVLVRQFLANHKEIQVIVHPVQQTYDPHAEESIQIGSFKLKRDLIKVVEARFFPDIVVAI